MKVSVIIPVYNAEEHLEECLKSVCTQTLRDIEILCVNDGSTDASAAILEAAAKADSRIRVLTQINAGAAAARNNALKHIQGDFVAFMDADDCYASDKVLELLTDAAEKHAAKMAGGGIELIGGASEEPWLKPEKTEGVYDFAEYPYDQGFTKYIYAASLFRDGLRFPAYKCYEDPPLLVAAMAKAGCFAAIAQVVYLYRVAERKEGKRPRMSVEKFRDYLLGLTDVLRLSAEGGLKAIHRETWKLVSSNDMRDYLCDLPTSDHEVFSRLIRLSAAGDGAILGNDCPELPVLGEIRAQAAFGIKLKRLCGGWLKDRVIRMLKR